MRRILITVLLISASALYAESEDWQFWSEQGMTGAFNEAWALTLRQEEKWSDQQGDIIEYNVDLGLEHDVSEHWLLGVNYRQSYEKKDSDWFEENRPHLNVTYKTRFEKVSVSDRSRLELRIKEDKSDIVRYRNKLTVQCNQGIGSWKPYIADEVFVDSAKGDLNRNRLYVGLKGRPLSKIKTDIYGLWQTSDKGSFWEDVFVLGLKAYAMF